MPEKTPRRRQAPLIAYVAQSFPDLTQTFIYREVLALERKGLEIATFAIFRMGKETLSEESRHLADRTFYALPLSWPGFLAAHLDFFFRRPFRYTGTALFILTRPGEPLKNRLRTFYHFCEAVYMAKEMLKRGVRHVHAHFSINAATIALVASRLLDISFSFTAHNILFTDRLILKEKIREALFIVAISGFTRQFLLRQVPGENLSGKIHIVHCGLEPGRFLPPEPRPANAFPLILFVGQLAERKGTPYLVEACRILAERQLAFHCVIVGDGPQKELVERQVRKSKLQDRVHLAGRVFQEQIRDYFRSADIFVLPCIQTAGGDMDGIPVSLMEAMAMEIPSISSPVSGIPELIEDGRNGLLVEEKNPLALADAIQRLMEDENLRRELGRKSREKVIREFDVDKSAEKLKNLFERSLSLDV